MNPVDPTHPVPVAIIGMGCLFPQADGLAGYWSNIRRGRDAITEVPASHWRPEDYFDPDPKAPDRTYARRGGFLSPVDFPPLDFGIAPNNLEATDTTQLLGLLVARQALDDAGYGEGSTRPLDRDRVSVILGVTGALELVIPLGARLGHPIWRRALKASGIGDEKTEEVVRRIADSYVGWQENSFPGLLGNVAAGRIANRLDLGGTNCVIDAACASSVGALNLAMLELAAGRCDLALTGGIDTFNDIFMYMCFSKTPALSPGGDARPFDAGCDGTVLGEGLGILALKRLDDARRDGNQIYAVVRSVGSSSDGKGNAVYAPKADGQAKSLRRAYRLAGFSPATVELVEAHGTGTKVGDATEVLALNEVYREARPEGTWCALGSVKSQIGHTKAAAGAAGIIKAALALHHKVLPPTIKVTAPIEGVGPGKSPFYVNAEARPWLPRPDHPRRAAVSAFGFGGSNFHCLLEEAEPAKTAIDWDGSVQILAFSAEGREALVASLDSWPSGLDWVGVRAEAARCRARFDSTKPHRLVLVADSETDREALFRKARTALQADAPVSPRLGRDGVFVGSGAAPGRLAMLFPGQGSQYVGMLRELACVFPQVQQTLADADASAKRRLGDQIYPFSAFSDAEKERNEIALRATDVAQPAIGALSLGLCRVLEHFGVRPDLTGGHSYGELTALAAAGWLDDPAFASLSRERGRLMAARAGAGNGGGAMLAVLAALNVVEEVLRDERLDLVVANKNAPRQFVLSGPSTTIARAAEAFRARQIGTRPLPVSAAFHSPEVAAAEAPFLKAVRASALAPTATPVYANTTAATYPSDLDAAHSLLAGQIARPVEFVAQIEAMARDGAGVFLEVGPDSKLTGLVRSILEGRSGTNARAVAVDASRGERGNLVDLASALAELATLGYPVLLSRWDEEAAQPARPARKPGLTVKISGANAKPRPSREPEPRPTTPASAAASGSHTADPPKSAPKPPMTPMPPSTLRSSGAATPASPHSNGEHAATPGRNGHSAIHATPPMTATSKSAAVPPSLVPIAGADPVLIARALRTAQDNLVALQRLGEQTADLHRQFLEGQEKAHRTFQGLLEQQQRLTVASLGVAPPSFPSVREVPTRRPAVEPATRREPGADPLLDHIAATPPPAARRHAESAPSTPLSSPKPSRVESSAPRPLPSSPPASEKTLSVLLGVVSEKTGYPAEMLELNMQLDADLGIDSIKRVEILSALQERLPDAPSVKPEHLGTLRTLQDIVDFLSVGEAATGVVAVAPVVETSSVMAVLLGVVSEKTGYPAEMLEPSMQLDADLGIDSIKRVEILSALQERLPDAPSVKPEHLGTLRTLQDIVDFLSEPSRDGPALLVEKAPAARTLAPSNVQRLVVETASLPFSMPAETLGVRPGGIIWVTDDGAGVASALVARLGRLGYSALVVDAGKVEATAAPDRLDGLILIAPRTGDGEETVANAFRWLRLLGPALKRSGHDSGAFAATVSRLDGAFGARAFPGSSDPAFGALAGLAKTAGHEWPEVRCRALDLDAELGDPAACASAIVDELLRQGPIEVGLTRDTRTSLVLTPVPIARSTGANPLDPGDLVLITGGARGVTAEVAVALAEAFRPTLVLLGRSPAPEREPDWLASLQHEAEIKRALATRANGHATPQLVGERFRSLAANREILRTLARIEAAGAKGVYRAVDVRDASAVGAAIATVRNEFGPVRGLIHGAGVLADRRIEDQTDAQFADVFATKVVGLRALLGAIGDDDLKALVLFSSTTARLGRSGQVAYAAANEALNKFARREAHRRPAARVVAVNWGPWDGGMVTPSLKPLFASEGVGLIPLAEGARYLVEEITAEGPNRPVEVVVMGGGSIPFPIAPTTVEVRARPTATAGTVHASLTTVFERPLDVKAIPILKSHVIDGRAVLPMALMLEWFAHGALQRNPGLTFQGLDDFRLLKGAVLHDDRPESLAVLVGKATRAGDVYRVPVELRGNVAGGKTLVHARAEVVLADRPPVPDRPPVNTDGFPSSPLSPRSVYRDVLFHGPDLHGIEQFETFGPDGAVIVAKTSPGPAGWLDRPLRQTWLTDPLAIDCAFQLMVLWCFEQTGASSLPTSVGRYRQFRRSFPAHRVRIAARVFTPAEHRATAEIVFLDLDGQTVARIDGYECVMDASLHQAFRRNRLHQPARSHR